MEKVKKLWGIENSPINCVLKRLGYINQIKSVEPPGYLDDPEPRKKIIDIFLAPYSPIIIYTGSKGKDWLVYFRRHFKRRSPFFLHIGFPAIPNSGWIKGEKKISPQGHLSLQVPYLHQISNFLGEANEIKQVIEEERMLIFSLFGWQFAFESKKSIEHILRTLDATKIITKIEDEVKKKGLQTWEQIKYEFEIDRGKPDSDKIQVKGFLNTIERHWKLKPKSSAKKK